MKLPREITDEIERLGRQVVAEKLGKGQAADRLAKLALRRVHRPIVNEIVRAAMASRLQKWISAYLIGLSAAEIEALNGQMPLPYPDLPPLLEVRPGRFVRQGAATRVDLRAALVQAETKESNAAGFAAKIRRLTEAALPLMPDDSVTLADIADRLRIEQDVLA